MGAACSFPASQRGANWLGSRVARVSWLLGPLADPCAVASAFLFASSSQREVRLEEATGDARGGGAQRRSGFASSCCFLIFSPLFGEGRK